MNHTKAFLYEFLSYAFDGLDRKLIKDIIDNALSRMTDLQLGTLEREFNEECVEKAYAKIRSLEHQLYDTAAQRDAQQQDISKAREVCPFSFATVTQLAESAATQYSSILSMRGHETVFDMTEHGPQPAALIPGQRVLVNNDEFIGIVLPSPVGDPRDTVRVRTPDGVVPRYNVKNVKPLPNNQL